MKKRFLAIFLLYLLLFSPAIASQDDINEEIKPEETSQEEVDLEMIQAVTVSTEEDDIPVITDLEPIEVHEKTLQEKLQDACDNPEMVMRMKNQAADFICEKYNWDEVVKETMKLYRRK